MDKLKAELAQADAKLSQQSTLVTFQGSQTELIEELKAQQLKSVSIIEELNSQYSGIDGKYKTLKKKYKQSKNVAEMSTTQNKKLKDTLEQMNGQM